MEKAVLEGLTEDQWNSPGGFTGGTTKTLDFAIDLKTSDACETPELDQIQVNYKYYVSSASLISSPYNTKDSTNSIGEHPLQWTENCPAGTAVKFQLRTAPDSSGSPGTWTGWMGPDGTDSTFFTDPNGTTEESPSVLREGDDDQWIQYKVFLTSTGPFAPTLSNVSLMYVVNAPPEFDATFGNNGVSAIQNNVGSTDPVGKVTIKYKIRDPDTDSGAANPFKITPSFKYSIDGGNSWSEDMDACVFASGDLDDKTVEAANYTLYTATWDPKDPSCIGKVGYLGQVFKENLVKIKVTIDDGEGAHATASQVSSLFTLDTKDPTNEALAIDASTQYGGNPANLTLACTDDSSLEMCIGLASGCPDDNWRPFNATSTIFLSDDPDTVYVTFRDIKGNEVSTQATTPETPLCIMVQDTSNIKVSPKEFRLFVAWKEANIPPSAAFAQYNIWRATVDSDADYTKIGDTSYLDSPDIEVNYWTDSTPLENQKYYYKITTQDANGNISYRSNSVHGKANGIQDDGEGGGGSDVTGPAISNVTSTDVYTTQATITWTTDELSDSTVGYGNATSSLTYFNVPTMDTSHSVTLANLSPDTDYYYVVKSKDPTGNETTENNSGNFYTFKTEPGPIISNVSVSDITNKSATIRWLTEDKANSYVIYSLNSDLSSSKTYGTKVLTTDLDKDEQGKYVHLVELPDLSQEFEDFNIGDRIYFYVQSFDAETGGNEAIDNNQGDYYYFNTTKDLKKPVISHISVATTAYTATITWKTDELSTSQVEWGTGDTLPYAYGNLEPASVTTTEVTIDHVVKLTGLSPNQVYHYRVRSKDVNNNEKVSSPSTFTPTWEADSTSPVISAVAVPSDTLFTTQATITWTTDELASSKVEYGTVDPSENLDAAYDKEASSSSMVTNHSLILTNLTPDTTYYFRVISTDFSDNEAIDDNSGIAYTFKTKAGPTISNVIVSSVVNEKATIKWLTDLDSDSKVVYSSSANLANPLTKEDSDLNTSHTIILDSLYPNTIYYFYVESKDKNNNTATSNNKGDYYYFTTALDEIDPTISNVEATPTATTATITWTTDELSTSQVEYGLTTDYGFETDISHRLTISHVVKLTGLTTGETYHYRVISEDANGNSAQSEDSTFKPQLSAEEAEACPVCSSSGGGGGGDSTPPKISQIAVSDITENSATISWKTNEIGTTALDYGLTSDYGFYYHNLTDHKTNHSVVLRDLTPGTTYHFRACSQDFSGNLTQTEDKTFTTLDKKKKGIVEGLEKITEEKEKLEEEETEGKEPSPLEIEEKESVFTKAMKAAKEVIASLSSEVSLMVLESSLSSTQEAIESAASLIPAPIIIGGVPKVEDITSNSATISWRTNKQSNSLIALAKEEDYDATKDEPYTTELGNSREMVKDHKVVLYNLLPSTTYHFQLRSKGKIGEMSKSADFTFTTRAELPEIKSYTISDITDKTATFTWITNTETDSLVEYIPYRAGRLAVEEVKTQGKPDFTVRHEVEVRDLVPGTTYAIALVSRDLEGNEVRRSIPSFSTSKDITPPRISQVKTETAIIPGAETKVQAIIYWLTDEPATSQVVFQKGVTLVPTFPHQTPLDSNLTLNHIVVITDFSAGSVYQFRVKSKDNAGNEAVSRDYTILTPRKTQSVLQIIIKNFEETFGWMKALKVL